MASIWEEGISNLAGNLNSGHSYLITTVHDILPGHDHENNENYVTPQL